MADCFWAALAGTYSDNINDTAHWSTTSGGVDGADGSVLPTVVDGSGSNRFGGMGHSFGWMGYDGVGDGESSAEALLAIFTGESNSGGFAVNADAAVGELAPRSIVQIFNNATEVFEALHVGVNNLIGHDGLTDNATHGMEIGLANTVVAGRFAQSTVYLVKTGQGGSLIADWDVGQAYWTTFLDRIDTAEALLDAAKVVYTPIVFYSQGINDFFAPTATAIWKAATIAHFAKIRAVLGLTTRIFMTKFEAPVTATTDYNTAMDEIAAADQYTLTLSSAGCSNRDGNHWSYAGFLTLSERFANSVNGASGTLAAPTPSVAAGSYDSAQTVTLSGPAGATIRYTVDGTEPTSHSSSYASPLSVSSSQTIKAIAQKLGWKNSAQLSAAYSIIAQTPTFSPAAGGYGSTQNVTISTATSGATIYYTTNGDEPTTGSTLYTTPVAVATSLTIKAIAVKAGLADSAVGSAIYTIAVPSVWDSVTKGTKILLTTGDTVLTRASQDGGHSCARGTVGRNSGKLYFELDVVEYSEVNNGILFGICDGTSSGATFNTNAGGFANSYGTRSEGFNSATGFTAIAGASFTQATGGRIMVAVDDDVGGGSVWVGYDGTWKGDFMPVGGSTTGRVASFTPGTTVYPLGGAFAPSNKVGLRTAVADQIYSPPSGFTAWDT